MSSVYVTQAVLEAGTTRFEVVFQPTNSVNAGSFTDSEDAKDYVADLNAAYDNGLAANAINKLFVWESPNGMGFVIIAAQSADEAWDRLKTSNPEAFFAFKFENGGDAWLKPDAVLTTPPTIIQPEMYAVDEFPDLWLINR
jgi:hypothetical protein